MTSINHLLNNDDVLEESVTYQTVSLTTPLSNTEQPPPVVPENCWDSLSSTLHDDYADYGGSFDSSSFGYLQFSCDYYEPWQHDGQRQGLEMVMPNDTCLDSCSSELDQDTPDVISEAFTFSDGGSPRICYGLIHRVVTKLVGDMSRVRQRLQSACVPKISGHAIFRVSLVTDEVWLVFPDGAKFAQLNTHLSKILPSILGTQHVEMEALVNIISFKQTVERAWKSGEASVRVSINIYGPRDATDLVGRELSKAKIFLQQPDHPRQGTLYENPHVLQLGRHTGEEAVIGVANAEEDSVASYMVDLGTAVEDIYGSLKRATHLHRLEGDKSLRTSLLPHQQEGLDFMIQREAGPIADQFCLWQKEDSGQDGEPHYRHVITSALSYDQPPETGGGVLADAMGLGKTLSILSLVAQTKAAAHDWSYEHMRLDSTAMCTAKRRSRATLVVVSSYLLLNHWLSEIDRHLNGSLKVMKHHGQRRERSAIAIANSDIVLTTYHTLAAEMTTDISPLHDIVWYRTVLDEAHIIRHRQTTFFQTCLKLSAANRWCLTGTPIQNTLDDIGALFSFIRVQPFDTIGTFRSYITLPFDESRAKRNIAAERLGKLMDSLCLRRTREVVDLPEQREVLRELDLSPQEREQYRQTKDMMNRAIRQRFGELDRKNIFGLFQAQLQLRLSCNHGTFQNPFLWTQHRNMVTEREGALDLYVQSGEVTCACCQQPLPLTGPNSTYGNSYSCRHICCFDCLEQSADGQDLDPELRTLRCPVCESGDTNDRKRKRTQGEGKLQASNEYFRRTGYSTKMECLVVDTQQELWSCKSVIFSCWTRTLDLVEKHFARSSIPFKRIDGSSPLHARQAILDDFSSNPDTPVLLMTTGTGAFGLNIPVANRIFIIESQWNPHTERQAIARAMRLGQQHPIVVYRYVINESVEQEMRSQQHRKLHIAEVGW